MRENWKGFMKNPSAFKLEKTMFCNKSKWRLLIQSSFAITLFICRCLTVSLIFYYKFPFFFLNRALCSALLLTDLANQTPPCCVSCTEWVQFVTFIHKLYYQKYPGHKCIKSRTTRSWKSERRGMEGWMHIVYLQSQPDLWFHSVIVDLLFVGR